MLYVRTRDGATKSSYLNGVFKTTEVHGLFPSATYEGTNGLASARWTRSETDFLGRTISESRPGFGGSTLVTSNYYDTAGNLVSTISLSTRSTCSTRLNARLYLYDNLNDRVAAVDDRNFNNAIDWTGPDLVSSNSTHYVKLDGDWWRETKSYSIHDDNSAVARLMGVRLSRVTGLGANGLASETISIDQRGNATTNRVFRNRASAEEIAWVKYPTSTTPAVTVSTNSLVCSSTSQTGVTTTFAYDAFQREVLQTDGRGNTTRTVYDSLGRVSSTIDALGYATAYGYDALGRQTSVTDPLTNTVYTAYDSEGHIVSQRGATYPVDYAYDEFGDKVSMTTYRDFIGERGTGNGESVGVAVQGDVTRWLRDEATGLVTNKVYADGKGPRYDYTPDGKLATRTWARGIVTTYAYDANGSLTNTVYSDGTPTLSLAYDRAGRQVEARDAAGTTTFAYDAFGSLTIETVVDVAGTNTIERFYDSLGRDLGYALNGVRQSTLAYDAATGRLVTMLVPEAQSNNQTNQTIKQFSWSYLPGSDLKSSLAYPNGLTASWSYGNRGELLEVNNASPTGTISRYAYTYDAAGRRIACAKSGTAFEQSDSVNYGYNTRSELTNATAAVDSAYRYGYDFDDIGNRRSSLECGVQSAGYEANSLNQYTAVDDFTPQYDADGNQTLVKTTTGTWQVSYNGENRPILWTQGTNTISMSFDRMGRRVTKNNQRFIYNGYLQIANFHSTTTTSDYNYFVWDCTENVATRPLVWQRGNSVAYYTHDGNKNVSEVIASNNDVAAHYEYAPFGALTVFCGESAVANPWRFSSEYAEDDTATVYYNYRHYEPETGRWLSMDPMRHIASLNLYAFLKAGCLSEVDRLGLLNTGTSITGQVYYYGENSKAVKACNEGCVISAFAKYRDFNLDRAMRAMRLLHSYGKEVSFATSKDLMANIEAQVKVCGCVKELYVTAHGYSQRRDGAADSNSVSISLGAGDENEFWEQDDDERISDYFGSMSGKFCADCHITLYSCSLGQNPFLRERLMRKTGCKITLFKWNIWSLTGNDFFDWFWQEGSWWPY